MDSIENGFQPSECSASSQEDPGRHEWIGGKRIPRGFESRTHTAVKIQFLMQLSGLIRGTGWQLYTGDYPVRLFAGMENPPADAGTLVMPDIFVLCDASRAGEEACVGAPDFVAEILSSSTADMDIRTKRKYYDQAGVREYWIVDPELREVSVFVREGTAFRDTFHMYRKSDSRIELTALEDYAIDLAEIFISWNVKT